MESLFNNQQPEVVPFDEIVDAFKTKTQCAADYEPKREPNAGELPPNLTDPLHQANEPEPELLEAETVLDHDHAQRTGERIARLVDTGIDFVLSNFVAKNGESYSADERDLQDIAEAWGEVAEEKQWNIGPEWTLAILYVMVYGPLVKQAFYDRRIAKIEARQREQDQRIRILEEQQKQQPGNGNPTTIHIDPDYNPNAAAKE